MKCINSFNSHTAQISGGVGVVLIGLLTGCAEYKAASVPVMAHKIPHASTPDADYEVFVTSFSDPEKQKTYFDTNFQEAGLVALQLNVRNNSPRNVSVRRSVITFELPGGERILPANPKTAAIHVGENGSVVGATIAFGLVGAITESQAEETARTARIADYETKGFKDANLGTGESAQGFVFFIPSAGTKPFDSSYLNVIFTDVDSAVGTTVRSEVRGVNFTGKDEANSGRTITTAGPTQTYAYASAPAGAIVATHSRISKNSERSRDSVTVSPDHASAVKKVEEKYERLISAQRKQRYNFGCDKSAKQAHTQTCQDVSLQIQLLEEGREKELARTDRQYRRAPASKSTPQQMASQPPSQVCDSGSKVDFVRDRKAIEDVLSDALDTSECFQCRFYEFKNIERVDYNCGQIKLAVTYTMEDVYHTEINQRSREIKLIKKDNKIFVEHMGEPLKK